MCEQFIGSYHCPECIKAWETRNDPERKIISFQRSNKAIENMSVYALAQAWRPRTSNVYLHGTVGTGKTYLAKCLIQRAVQMYLGTSVLTGMEFISEVGGSGGYGRKTGLPGTIVQPDVILIDDVDKCPWTPTSLGWLWQLLDIRRGRERSTIMTANQTPQEIIEHWEKYIEKNKSVPFAIMDRMKPMLVLELVGPSLRTKEDTLQKANQQQELAYE